MIVSSEMDIYYVESDAGNSRVFETMQMVDASGNKALNAVRETVTLASGQERAISFWPDDVTIEGVELVRPVTHISEMHARIQVSAPVNRPSGVTPDQARKQLEAIVKTAQADFASCSVYDDGAMYNPVPVRFYVGEDHQNSVMGVSESDFNTWNDLSC